MYTSSHAIVMCEPMLNEAVVKLSPTASPRLSEVKNVAEHRHRQHDHRHRPQERQVDGGHDPHADVTRDGREVAVREVDHLHHAEQQREPAREQRVQAAGQDALDDGVNPGH
jgi:hypothetical protein